MDKLTQDIERRYVLYYDTDMMYIIASGGSRYRKIIDDNIICLNAAYNLYVQVRSFDHLIINGRKSIIRFNGDITDFVVGNYAEMLSC
jgi:hypothetical protein